MTGASTVDLRLRDAEELRAVWLDGFADGGIFVPGAFALAAGSGVRLRIHAELPTPTTTILEGTVVWRRVPPRDYDPRASGVTLRPGIGVAFAPAMRPRVLFLERMARGAASEARLATRYPSDLAAELAVRSEEHPAAARIVDVAVHGARVVLASAAFVEVGGAIELRVTTPRSGEAYLAALHGRVAWLDREARKTFGVRLELATSEERLHWAKIVTRARDAFEAQPIKLPKRA